MSKVRIAILDSGIRRDHPAFSDKDISGFSLRVENGNVNYCDDFSDNIGHGTAVFYLISRVLKDVQITNIKIYDKNHSLEQIDLVVLLKYIYEKFEFDVINISMGFIICGNVSELQCICDKFHKKGTIIVSAFDNNGAVSFPAALNNVVGVDCREMEEPIKNRIYVENSIVDIVGKSRNVRVAWLDPDYIIVRGSSFLCADVTANIAELMKKHESIDLHQLCSDVYSLSQVVDNRLNFNLNRVAIFPFNKEIHSVARFEDMLNCEVVDYYSARISGHVGKKISELIYGCSNSRIIKNIDAIDWNSFDTLIIGHTGELSKLTGTDYISLLVKGCVENGKNIYSFDKSGESLRFLCDAKKINMYSPCVSSDNIKKRFGKLYKTDKPIVAVIGTNSRQGKFTFQLYLRKKLLEIGYSVGQIGTEPSSPLFGIDEVFPCGYNGQVSLDIPQTYIAVNDMIWNITQKDVDLIIAGVQSGFLAYNDYNAMMFPFYHQLFFSALQPDAIILCINPYDEIDFIKRNVMAAEGFTGAKVIGIVCFPLDASDTWSGVYGKMNRISYEKELQIKSSCHDYVGKKVYMLDKNEELDDLISECISYFR